MPDYEHDQQAALIQNIGYHLADHPELALLFAIPNGGARNVLVARKMKQEGVKPGVPDLCLPIARGPYHGIFIEMKAVYPSGQRGSVKKEQALWHQALREQGYRVEVCYSWTEAYDTLVDYLLCRE